MQKLVAEKLQRIVEIKKLVEEDGVPQDDNSKQAMFKNLKDFSNQIHVFLEETKEIKEDFTVLEQSIKIQKRSEVNEELLKKQLQQKRERKAKDTVPTAQNKELEAELFGEAIRIQEMNNKMLEGLIEKASYCIDVSISKSYNLFESLEKIVQRSYESKNREYEKLLSAIRISK